MNFFKIRKYIYRVRRSRYGIFQFFVLSVAVLFLLIFLVNKNTDNYGFNDSVTPDPQLSATITPYLFPYKIPPIPKNRSYRIVIAGDSIVESLGLNANTLREDLIVLYPENEFVIYNYGYASTSILTLPDRLTKKTKNRETENSPILDQGFEIIIIESFGYNPISNLSIDEGLKKQEEILEQSVRLILTKKPDAVIIFLTPIALDENNFARNTYDLSAEQRKNWVNERKAYIQKHREFAEERGIPVVDVYKSSLGADGLVRKELVAGDYIHPSGKGISLISREIAAFIFENKILPQ